MIENISYENMKSYSKELQASSEVIKELIQDKDFPELNNFVDAVENYANYLKNTVDMYEKADRALEQLKIQNKTS